MNSTPLVIEQFIEASAHRIWQALTNKDEMKQWYFTLDDFKAVPGFEFSFPGKGAKGEEYIHLCKVLEVVPAQKLSYSWQYKGYPGFSTVTFDLIPRSGGTLVRITHEGLDSFPKDMPDFAIQSFQQGWTSLIGKHLPAYVSAKN